MLKRSPKHCRCTITSSHKSLSPEADRGKPAEDLWTCAGLKEGIVEKGNSRGELVLWRVVSKGVAERCCHTWMHTTRLIPKRERMIAICNRIQYTKGEDRNCGRGCGCLSGSMPNTVSTQGCLTEFLDWFSDHPNTSRSSRGFKILNQPSVFFFSLKLHHIHKENDQEMALNTFQAESTSSLIYIQPSPMPLFQLMSPYSELRRVPPSPRH